MRWEKKGRDLLRRQQVLDVDGASYACVPCRPISVGDELLRNSTSPRGTGAGEGAGSPSSEVEAEKPFERRCTLAPSGRCSISGALGCFDDSGVPMALVAGWDFDGRKYLLYIGLESRRGPCPTGTRVGLGGERGRRGDVPACLRRGRSSTATSASRPYFCRVAVRRIIDEGRWKLLVRIGHGFRGGRRGGPSKIRENYQIKYAESARWLRSWERSGLACIPYKFEGGGPQRAVPICASVKEDGKVPHVGTATAASRHYRTDREQELSPRLCRVVWMVDRLDEDGRPGRHRAPLRTAGTHRSDGAPPSSTSERAGSTCSTTATASARRALASPFWNRGDGPGPRRGGGAQRRLLRGRKRPRAAARRGAAGRDVRRPGANPRRGRARSACDHAGELGVLRIMPRYDRVCLLTLSRARAVCAGDPSTGSSLPNGYPAPPERPDPAVDHRAAGPRAPIFQTSFHQDFRRHLNGYVASVNTFLAIDDFSRD